MSRGIFVTGTDTGVGKTFVAGGLCALLRKRGVNIGVMKPIESGCRREGGRLIPDDAISLREMAGCQDELEIVNPYVLEHPLAAAVAAEMEGVEIKLEVIKRAYQRLASRHSFVVVEGAGGLLVPLMGRYFVADLAKELELPLLLITRAQLGTINHTLLTLYYAQREGIPVLGVVMDCTSEQKGLAESLNPAALQRWSGVPFLGVVPFIAAPSAEAIIAAIERNLNLEPIEALLRGVPLAKQSRETGLR